MVELYRRFFPEEFARDGVDYSSGQALLNSYDRFVRLVDSNLFPVHSLVDQDLVYHDVQWGLNMMSVCLHQHERFLWWERHRRGVALSMVERLIVVASERGDFPGITFGKPVPRDQMDFDYALLKICEKQEGMMSRLFTASMAVLGETGEFWLDMTEEDYYQCDEDSEWSESCILWYADTFKEAKKIYSETAEFLEWANASPERVDQVKALLSLARSPKKQRRARVTAKKAKPLIETLGDVL